MFRTIRLETLPSHGSAAALVTVYLALCRLTHKVKNPALITLGFFIFYVTGASGQRQRK